MNGTVSRRVFVGSLAGAGVGATGAALLDLPLSAQRASADPVVRELHTQLKDAFGKMRDGKAIGARQAATVLRVWASTVNDGQFQATLRNANRSQLLLTEMNHEELVRQAKELGIDPSKLPRHSLDRVGREAALGRLIKEGLSQSLREAADYVDGVGTKMERLERAGGARPLQVALRQPIPDTVDCGNCNQEKQQVENAQHVMEVACAAALLFPLLGPACEGAAAAYLVVVSAAAICLLVVQLCEAYYH
jgi:hypothetical protein